MIILRFLGWLLGETIFGLVVVFVVVIGGLILLLEFDVIGPADRGTTLSQAREEVHHAGFTSAAVVGESVQNGEEGLVKQSFYVLVGKQNREVDNPDTEPCRATVTWERGTLTLTSATGKIQSNTTNTQALDLPEYAGCA